MRTQAIVPSLGVVVAALLAGGCELAPALGSVDRAAEKPKKTIVEVGLPPERDIDDNVIYDISSATLLHGVNTVNRKNNNQPLKACKDEVTETDTFRGDFFFVQDVSELRSKLDANASVFGSVGKIGAVAEVHAKLEAEVARSDRRDTVYFFARIGVADVTRPKEGPFGSPTTRSTC